MSYAEQFKKSQDEGKTKPVSAGIFKLDADTPEIIGKVIGVTKKTFAGLGKESDVCVLDTDDGECLVLAGLVCKNFFAKRENEGKLVKITWIGMKHPEKGQPYNEYELIVAE